MLETVIPDIIEPVVAYRGWNLGSRFGHEQGKQRLFSVTRNNEEWESGQPKEAVCDSPPSVTEQFMTDLQWDVNHMPDDVIRSWQQNAPIRIIRGGIEVTLQLSMRGNGEAITKQFEEGVLVRFDPKEGRFNVRTLAEIEEPPEPPPPPHPKPHACGIYAVTVPNRIPHADVYGVVHLTGAVIPGEYGYRAQRAEIAGFINLPGPAPTVALAERYQVPLLDAWPEATDPRALQEGDGHA